MSDQITQNNNEVHNGDIVARDKITNVTLEEVIIVQPEGAIRQEITFSIDCDSDNTTLVMKLEKGGFEKIFIQSAKKAKIQALSILIRLLKTEEGKAIIADIYENLINVFQFKYFSQLKQGEEVRARMHDIYNELSALCFKYKNILDIDEAFLTGLLYLATSNCAIWWKNEK